MDKFIESNGIKLHYLEFEGDKPTIILAHGLTANASCFDGLVKAGLSPKYHFISVDLRGRGQSDKPATGYTMADHAKDIIGLLDQLGIEKAVFGGHSFGALLTFYLATYYPDRIDKMILLDAAAQMHPNTREMLIPTMSRLGQVYPSFDTYIEKAKQAPYLNYWEDTMYSYFKADLKELENGTFTTNSKPEHIVEAINGVFAEPWLDYMKGVNQKAILINATGAYNLGEPLLPKENALETVSLMKNCTYKEVWGNHQTMLYGQGAKEIVKAIDEFLNY